MEKKKSSRKEQKPEIRDTEKRALIRGKKKREEQVKGEERERRGKKKRVHTDAPVHDGSRN